MEIKICDNCGGHTGLRMGKVYERLVDRIDAYEDLDLCPECGEKYLDKREKLHETLRDKFSTYKLKSSGLDTLF